jgi:hypothetical protein
MLFCSLHGTWQQSIFMTKHWEPLDVCSCLKNEQKRIWFIKCRQKRFLDFVYLKVTVSPAIGFPVRFHNLNQCFMKDILWFFKVFNIVVPEIFNPNWTGVWEVHQVQGSAQFDLAFMRCKFTSFSIWLLCNWTIRFREIVQNDSAASVHLKRSREQTQLRTGAHKLTRAWDWKLIGILTGAALDRGPQPLVVCNSSKTEQKGWLISRLMSKKIWKMLLYNRYFFNPVH